MQRAEEFFSREARACELLASQTSSDTHRANLLLMARHYREEASEKSGGLLQQGSVISW